MKLLLDENLSPRLVARLVSLFSDLTHVRDVGLRQAKDQEIWDWATISAYNIVTSDSDFVDTSERLGWPPKVIHIAQCDFPFRVIEDMVSSKRRADF